MQVAPTLNDENSSLPSTAGQFKLQLQPPKQASALKSARKAFGNITNNGQQAARSNKDDAASAKPQRRVFGDITNSAAKPPAGPTTVKKQPAGTSSLFAAVPTARKSAAAAAAADAAPAAQGTSSSTSQTTSAPVTDQQASSSSKAEWWEGLEPERPVGKTAAQLDAELDAAMEADALRSADDIWQNVIGKGLTSCIIPPLPDDSDDEAAAFKPLGEVPELSDGFESVPDLPSEELMYASDTDFASLLPDIKWPRSEDDDDSSSTEDNDEEDASSSSMSAAVNQLAEAVADVLTIAADGGGSEPAGICSSPAGAAPAPAVDHAELRSPEALPW